MRYVVKETKSKKFPLGIWDTHLLKWAGRYYRSSRNSAERHAARLNESEARS